MRIMLYSDIPPCMNYTAGIVLDKLCSFLLDSGHAVCCLSIETNGLMPEIPPDKKERMVFKHIDKPHENYGRRFRGKIGKIASLFGNNYDAYIHLPKIIRSAVNFARVNKAEIIWGVVQGQTMIKTLRPLAKKARLSYVVQIWDPPTWWLRENGFDKFTRRLVINEYEAVIRNSACCITASESMNDEYLKRYKPRRAVPVILGFAPSRVTSVVKDNNSIVIALSGQIYAKKEFKALISAINLLKWIHDGKRIVLRLYGRNFNVFHEIVFPSSANIVLCGWLLQDELLSELATADMLYCPYWFDKEFHEEASLSFPSKLSTYFKTGVPVLIHAPDYASPRKFIEKHNAGYVCGSLEKEVIADTLRLIFNDTNKSLVGEHGFEAFSKYLTTDIMRSNFFSALGIS